MISRGEERERALRSTRQNPDFKFLFTGGAVAGLTVLERRLLICPSYLHIAEQGISEGVPRAGVLQGSKDPVPCYHPIFLGQNS